ncbi:alpha/beta hydrolase [Streptomyces sp. SAI-041]|uniref:alpha/beta hydrolase n=1 Tax=unclassified Streptomyces TaxID=2593676 RepID=UPI0032AF3129
MVEAFLHASSPVERDAPGGRRALERAQSGRALLPETDAEWVTVPGGPTGGVPVRIVRPRGTTAVLPVVLCLHGPGWVFSSAVTHDDRLVRELAVGADAAVVFPEYTRPPEAAYPVALQQIHTVARRPAGENGPGGLDGTRMAVAGDSAGGTLAAALTLPAKEHGDVRFAHQVLFCPVTDAGCDSASYERFASGYRRAHARRRDQLAGLPPGLVITAEADVVRDEGEAYAAGLRAAGVPVTAVRHLGVVHGFVLLAPCAAPRPPRRPSPWPATPCTAPCTTHCRRLALDGRPPRRRGPGPDVPHLAAGAGHARPVHPRGTRPPAVSVGSAA